MNTFQSTEILPSVPDNLSIPQFFLDYQEGERLVNDGHPVKGVNLSNPWLIENRTGRSIGLNDVRIRIHLSKHFMSDTLR